MAKITVDLIGCGFATELHMHAYRRVYGVEVEVAAVAARGDYALAFAKQHRIPTTSRDFRALLADDSIDVVDICTPPAIGPPRKGAGSRRRSRRRCRRASIDRAEADRLRIPFESSPKQQRWRPCVRTAFCAG
jgi:ribose 1,5-bisphosphokinase PhnN